MEKPGVFEEGAVTIVASPGGCSVYIGSVELKMLSGVVMEDLGDGMAPKVKLTIQKSHDKEVALRLDEELRITRSIPWIEVER